MITVLFARRDSVYKTLPDVDVWDAERNALRWPGGSPVVAHPPCRAWGRLRTFARPAPGEADLSLWAIIQVRRYGGVLEHPAYSTLWKFAHLPGPGSSDEFGGWTLPIHQASFGHKAEKATWLYIMGCLPRRLPDMPLCLDEPTHVVQSRKPGRPHITKAEREHTPIEMARWLIEVAQRCSGR